MSGNTITPQILATSTVAGISTALLPSAGAPIFLSVLILAGILVATIVVLRMVKFAKTQKSK